MIKVSVINFLLGTGTYCDLLRTSLNKRIRTLLRLENLFSKIDFFLTKDTPTEHHAALVALFEVLEITARADIKSDLLQELERQKHLLEALRKNPNVDETTLNTALGNIRSTFREMLITGKLRGICGKMIGLCPLNNAWPYPVVVVFSICLSIIIG